MGEMNIFNEDTTADKLEIQLLLIQLNKINLFLVRTCIKFYLVITIRYKEFLPRWTTNKKMWNSKWGDKLWSDKLWRGFAIV